VPYQSRTFSSDQDLLRLSDFVVRVRSQAGNCAFYQIGDLSWAIFLFEIKDRPPEFIRIWESLSGELAGFAFFNPPSSVDIQSAPWIANREELEDEMLAWAAEIRRTQTVEERTEMRLTVAACEQDSRFISFITNSGYRRDSDYRLHMSCDLATACPEPALPAGFTIRPVEDEELEARGTLQRSVWPWSRVGPENYPRLRSMPGYLPELDLVVVSPQGELAAFALVWYDSINLVGEFEPVGTGPAFRQKGLGKALLLEGLRRVRQLGALECLVYPTGEGLPARNLYESAGFTILQRLFDYSKAVLPK
jgi:mycothiol synthase